MRQALDTLRAACHCHPWVLRTVAVLLTAACWWGVPWLRGTILSCGIGYLWSRLDPPWKNR